MEAQEYNLTISQGADYTCELLFSDSDGDPIDISGDTFASQLKTSFEDTTALVSFTIVKAQTANKNDVTLSLSSTQTAALPVAEAEDHKKISKLLAWDLLWTRTAQNDKVRPVEGTAFVSPRITVPT